MSEADEIAQLREKSRRLLVMLDERIEKCAYWNALGVLADLLPVLLKLQYLTQREEVTP